jgi:hypothetical protein
VLISLKNKEALCAWLDAQDIDTSDWGFQSAKSVQDLWNEYTLGEIKLEESPLRRVITGVVQVLIFKNSRMLMEIHQELSDGRTRIRNRPPSEKRKPGESPQETARRCLYEELECTPDQVHSLWVLNESPQMEHRFSQSFPGLLTCYPVFQVVAEVSGLPEDAFQTKERGDSLGSAVLFHHWEWRRPEENYVAGLAAATSMVS